MLENTRLPEYVQKMFLACAADYKKAHTPYSSSYKVYKNSGKKFNQKKLSKLLSVIY